MNFKILSLATASLMAIAIPASAQPRSRSMATGATIPAAMDKSVKPGDDFWAYVNGTWDKNTPIAADRASAGPFVTLSDKAEKDVREIVEQLAKDPNRDHLGQQIGDYYASFVDTAAIEAAGTAPLKPYIAEINAAKTRSELLSLFIKPGFASPVDVGIAPDFKNPDALSSVRRPGDARHAEPRILSRRQCEDEGAPRRLSRLYHHHPEARRPARRRGGRRPHHRARDRACRRCSGRPPIAATSTRSTTR